MAAGLFFPSSDCTIFERAHCPVLLWKKEKRFSWERGRGCLCDEMNWGLGWEEKERKRKRGLSSKYFVYMYIWSIHSCTEYSSIVYQFQDQGRCLDLSNHGPIYA